MSHRHLSVNNVLKDLGMIEVEVVEVVEGVIVVEETEEEVEEEGEDVVLETISSSEEDRLTRIQMSTTIPYRV